MIHWPYTWSSAIWYFPYQSIITLSAQEFLYWQKTQWYSLILTITPWWVNYGVFLWVYCNKNTGAMSRVGCAWYLHPIGRFCIIGVNIDYLSHHLVRWSELGRSMYGSLSTTVLSPDVPLVLLDRQTLFSLLWMESTNPGEFLSQQPEMCSFCVSFVARSNKQLSCLWCGTHDDYMTSAQCLKILLDVLNVA